MSSYKELNNLISQSKKFFDKKYKNLSAAEQKELSNLSYKIKITREDLLKKIIQKQLKMQLRFIGYFHCQIWNLSMDLKFLTSYSTELT